MATFLRHNAAVFIGIGAGICLGAGGTILYVKLTPRISSNVSRDLAKLLSMVNDLKREIQELRQSLNTGRKSRLSTGFYSVHVSSGDDDDDEYEEAFGGIDKEEFNEEIGQQLENSLSSNLEFDETKLFSRVDKLIGGSDNDKMEAYKVLMRAESKLASSPQFQWRAARCCYLFADIEGGQGDSLKKKELMYAAQHHSLAAVDLDDSVPEAHKWYAIALGTVGDYEGTQQKIKNGYLVRQHTETAIKLNPRDASLHYMMGRWCYGVYKLTWLERKIASTLFAVPPTATIEDALEYFLEADRLNPGKWKELLLYIAKSHIELHQYDEVVSWLQMADDLPIKAQDDKTAQIEIDSLLEKYRR